MVSGEDEGNGQGSRANSIRLQIELRGLLEIMIFMRVKCMMCGPPHMDHTYASTEEEREREREGRGGAAKTPATTRMCRTLIP